MFEKGYVPWNKGGSSWNRGIPCAEETKVKIGIANKGKLAYNKNIPLSEKTKHKISETKKKKYANGEIKLSPTCFKKGTVPWDKGKKCPQISLALTGKKRSLESRQRQSKSRTGIIAGPQSIETRIKIGLPQRGENNHNWNGGITPENHKIRNSIETRLWRESVFARDNWVCQKCSVKGGNLHPHHIKNFAEWIELRFAIDNGITLCEMCHKLFHSKFGRKKNDIEQLRTFINTANLAGNTTNKVDNMEEK